MRGAKLEARTSYYLRVKVMVHFDSLFSRVDIVHTLYISLIILAAEKALPFMWTSLNVGKY
jgi:hypothetical protein